jgi:hypothetical protein
VESSGNPSCSKEGEKEADITSKLYIDYNKDKAKRYSRLASLATFSRRNAATPSPAKAVI